jgi:glycolate oxidase iron-sulfur subunit
VARFLFRHLLPHRARIAALSDALELYQRTGLHLLVNRVLGAVAPGAARLHAAQPSIPSRRERRVETDRRRPGGFPARGPRRARVALFLGCVGAEWFAPVHRATIRVLQRNGCDVIIPHAQTCCGALHRHAGMTGEAAALLEANAHAFAGGDVDAVVVNAAGCGASLREPPEGVAALPIRDVCELLDELGLVPPDRPVPRKVTYDQPCHLVHAQRVGKSVVEGLLARIPEIQLLPLPRSERCCGAGGVYSLFHPEMAGPILEDKVRDIVATGAEIVATGNPGCAMQLALGLRGRPVEVLHPVQLLDQAYSTGA